MNEDEKTYAEPSEVTAEAGTVHIEGPDSINVTLTPEAAEETSNRLLEGAFKARGQRHLKDYPHQAK